MKKISLLSLILAIAVFTSIVSIPTFAETGPSYFNIQGKVVLPGNDAAPDAGMFVTLSYRSDNGTVETADDITDSMVVVLMKDSREAQFSWDIPYSATDRQPEFVLGYTMSPAFGYWEEGYYSSSGMQYYQQGQTLFTEGSVSGLVITPIRAVEISGVVGLPSYATAVDFDVNVSAKTMGPLTADYDDYEAKAKVTIIDSAVSYKLIIPETVSTAGYIVKYDTRAANYEKQGWYSTTGTVITASSATKVDVSSGKQSNVNLQLVSITAPDPVTPPDVLFDLNDDGVVNVRDMVLVARSMGSVKKFVAAFDLNEDGVINVKDLKIIKDAISKAKYFRQKLK